MVLQVSDRTITVEEVIPLISNYSLFPQVLREIIIEQAIAPIQCSSEEIATAYQRFWAQNQLNSETKRQTWLERHGMTLEQLEAVVTRELRVEKFKQAKWGPKLESYFLQRKGQLDKAIYSLIRTHDLGIAKELYFRIQEGEQSFDELARQYSQGLEADTGGILGPVALAQIHPAIARILSISQPKQLWSPLRIEQWFVIIRLEKFLPAQLDEPMRHRLMNELFENWLQDKVQLQPISSGQLF